jgi:hypothetical protein
MQSVMALPYKELKAKVIQQLAGRCAPTPSPLSVCDLTPMILPQQHRASCTFA